MPFNGSGVFVRNYSWTQDATNSIPISATRMDSDTNDIASGLTNCITRDGQGGAAANIPMGGYKLTNCANAALTNEYVTLGQANTLYLPLAGGTVTGAVTFSSTVAINGAATLSSTLSVGGALTVNANVSSSTASLILATSAAGTIQLRPNGSGSSTGQLNLDSSGNVTIAGGLTVNTGPSTFSGGLSASGRSSSIGNVNLGGQSYAAITWAGGTFYVGTNFTSGQAEVDFFNAFSSGAGFNFYKSNGSSFSLLSGLNSSGVWSATDFQSTSDPRLKDEVRVLARGMEALKLMVPREYVKYENAEHVGNRRREIGFLSTEVRKVLPEAVTVGDGGFDLVSYGQVVALLASAVLDIDRRLTEAGI